jgi:hypothetical protein
MWVAEQLKRPDISQVPRGWQADTTPALNNIPTSGSAQAFNDLVLGGNRAAQQGQFETAIDFWKRAAPLDQSPNINCRGESLHIPKSKPHRTPFPCCNKQNCKQPMLYSGSTITRLSFGCQIAVM